MTACPHNLGAFQQCWLMWTYIWFDERKRQKKEKTNGYTNNDITDDNNVADDE